MALTDEEDAELGIAANKGKGAATVTETLAKVKGKTDRYENAKQKVAQIFTGAPKEPVESPAAPKKPEKSSAQKEVVESGTRSTFHLKNGRTFMGTVGERDKDGFWVEVEPGVNMYLKNDEIKQD